MTSPTPICLRRLNRELADAVGTGVSDTIFVDPCEDNVTRVTALIMGPDRTPYEGGAFHVSLRFPPDYPYNPPKVKLLTTAGGTVRFNPNLYADGTVCLSILGTWQGPQWSIGQSLSTVLLSIQSLLDKAPYFNEPGFKHEVRKGDSERYSNRVKYETLRVAFAGYFDADGWEAPMMSALPERLRQHLVDFCAAKLPYYKAAVASLEHLDGQSFQDPFDEMHGAFDLQALRCRIDAALDRLVMLAGTQPGGDESKTVARDGKLLQHIADDDVVSEPEDLDV